MRYELAWLEEWCAENIRAPIADDMAMAELLATLAESDAQKEGFAVGPLVGPLGYISLADFMLDQLGSRADLLGAPPGKKPRRDYARRAHQPDPAASYGFTTDRQGRAVAHRR